MLLKNCIFFFVIFSFFFKLSAQQTENFTISGYIKELNSSETIIGALVEDSAGLQKAVSNEYGFFSLNTTKRKDYTLKIKALGYQTILVNLHPEKDSLYTFFLNLEEQDEIIITQNSPFEAASRIELSRKQLERLPSIGSEKDILKALSLFPGVSGSDEGSSHLLVRGGSHDQNLILLDGTPVYNVSHLAGFVSIFNSDALKKVELYKGGYPASFGGRLSSVLNILMKEGNARKWEGNFGIGIIASRLLLEGPVLKDKLSLMLSGRAAYLGLFTLLRQPALNQGKVSDNFIYNFFDFNAKINYLVNPKHHIFLSFYTGRDISVVVERAGGQYKDPRYVSGSSSGFDWGNSTLTLRHNWLICPKFFAKSQISYTQYQYLLQFKSHFYDFSDSVFVNTNFGSRSRIQDLIAKWQLEYNPHARHQFKFGFDGFYHFYTPYFNRSSIYSDSISRSDTLGYSGVVKLPEGGIFAEGSFRKGSIELNYGFRWSFAYTDGQFYHIPEPRFSTSIRLHEGLFIRAAYTKMGQYLHLLANNGVGFPNDIWVPITRNIPPQQAQQFSLGTIFQFKNLRIETEAYYKMMNQLIDYQYISGSLIGLNNDWESLGNTAIR